MDPSGNIVPNLATRWNWDSRSHTLTFTLKKGLTYHNGALIRTEDVLYSLKTIREQEFFHLDLTGPSKRIKSYRVNEQGDVEVRRHNRWDLIGGLVGGFAPRAERASGRTWA